MHSDELQSRWVGSVAGVKCWQFTLPRNTDMLEFVRVIHFCHIILTLRYELTFLSRGGPLFQTAFHLCKPLHIFNRTSGHFKQYLWHQNRHNISSCVCGGKTVCFQGDVWTFLAVCGTKLYDIFGETLQNVQLCYSQQHRVFLPRRHDISSCVY